MFWGALQKHKDHLNQGKQKSFSVLVVSLSLLDCHTRTNVRCSLLRHINQNMTHISEYHLGVLSTTSAICVITCIPAKIQPQNYHEISAQTVFHLHPWMHSSMHPLHEIASSTSTYLSTHCILIYKFLWCATSTTIPNSHSCTEKYFCSKGPCATTHENSVHSTVSTEKKKHIRELC